MNVKKEEIKTKIMEDFVLKIDGIKASQSVIMDRKVLCN